MQVPVSNRTLRSFMAGAVVLLGASACSRSDRAESGSDNTAATMQEHDTAVSRATQDVPGTGQDRGAIDTANPTSENTGTGAAAGDTAPGDIRSKATNTSAVGTAGATGARDTLRNAGRVRPIEDSTETAGTVTRDTGNVSAATSDSAAAGDAAIGARGEDTAGNAGRVRPTEDSTEMRGTVPR